MCDEEACYVYVLTTNTYSTKDGNRIGYGIALQTEKGLQNERGICFPDLCTEPSAVAKLIETCNRLQLYPLHLQDVVEDFLTLQ